MQGPIHDDRCHTVPDRRIEGDILQHQFLGGVHLAIEAHHLLHQVIFHVQQAFFVAHEHTTHHGIHITAGILGNTRERLAHLQFGGLALYENGHANGDERKEVTKLHDRWMMV